VARVPITVMGCQCERCDYEWIPRDLDAEPESCPRCKSPYWNRPRKRGESKTMTTYEDFRAVIQKTLSGTGKDLTWTEIRTLAKLPQKFPNNQWVHRLETDIGLERKRDQHGIIHWRLR
jgi:hypothetical protein